jgi:hypothetical protein
MEAIKSSHTRPENIHRMRDEMLPVYITNDAQQIIADLEGRWIVFQRVPGTFATRRAAAEVVADPTAVIA